MVFQLSLPSAHLHIEKRTNSVCLWKKCVYLGQREHLVFKSCSDFVIGSEQQGGFILDPAGAQGSKEHKTVVVWPVNSWMNPGMSIHLLETKKIRLCEWKPAVCWFSCTRGRCGREYLTLTSKLSLATSPIQIFTLLTIPITKSRQLYQNRPQEIIKPSFWIQEDSTVARLFSVNVFLTCS